MYSIEVRYLLLMSIINPLQGRVYRLFQGGDPFFLLMYHISLCYAILSVFAAMFSSPGRGGLLALLCVVFSCTFVAFPCGVPCWVWYFVSSNGCHYGPIFFKPEKNLEFFRLKNWPIDDYPGRLE